MENPLAIVNMNTIKEDDYAIVKLGQCSRVVEVSLKKPVFIGKQMIRLEKAVGKPFGSLFELKKQDLIFVEQNDFIDVFANDILPESTKTTDIDNRSLVDDGKSQKLTRNEIEELKSKGCDAVDIVRTIVEHSSSFKEKTQFSQEKYIKRKQSKYSNIVTISQPTIRLLTEMYFAQSPSKLCNMRVDSLSQMLSYANIVPGGTYLVVDDCLGLLVAAVLDRVGTTGHVIQIYPGLGPVSSSRQAVNSLNIPSEVLIETLHGIPFGKALDVLRNKDNVTEGNDGKISEDGQNNAETMDVSSEKEPILNKQENLKKEARIKRKIERLLETEKALKILETRNLDGLLVTCRHHPLSVAIPLVPFLAYSRPIVIHTSCLQPLVDCYKELKTSREAIFLNITENWMREYQVLRDRTHPCINMSNTGGYVLTGIRVEKFAY